MLTPRQASPNDIHQEPPQPSPAAHTRPLHLLIIESDPAIRRVCTEAAARLGFLNHTADTVDSAMGLLASTPIDLILLDVRVSDDQGLSFLQDIRTAYPRIVVVVMTAYASVDSAVESLRIGAADFLVKPFSLEELAVALERAARRRVFDLESRGLREKLRSGHSSLNLIGNSPPMEKLYRILAKVAQSLHPVLILGESGVGKEVVARTIHINGPQPARPFVPVDCGALVPSLIESELFGYVKGAFTGATRNRTGLLASAEGGTVFLDEIGELPLDLQAKLLRALQEKEVRPVGANHTVPIRARIVAATNRDLAAMVESGRFRKDLYYRLNVVNLRIPPLRERKQDIPQLATHILTQIERESGKQYSFSEEALRLMMLYDWPGNVRELEHAIERACALSSGPVLHMADFPTQLQDPNLHHTANHTPSVPVRPAEATPALVGGIQTIADLEKQAILNTLRHLDGDKLMAARLLGIGKTTLYRKLKEYGIADDKSLL